ncbi:MAG: hypothetical protein ABI690_26575 [Chloroflexota bacterium]
MIRIRGFFALLLILAVPLVAHAQDKVLPETFISEDGSLSLHYPTGWYADMAAEGQVWVSTSRIPQFGRDDIPSGEAGVSIVVATNNQSMSSGLFQGDNPLAILKNFVDTMSSWGNDRLRFAEPETVDFADQEAARVYAWMGHNEIFIIIASDGLNQFSLVVGYAPDDELEKVEPKLLAIAESTTYQTPPNL